MSQLRRKIDNRPIPKSAVASQPVRSGDLNKVIDFVNELQTQITALENQEPADSRPYGVLTILLGQSGTNAPTIEHTFEDTINQTIELSRSSTGTYSIKIGATLDLSKTVYFYNYIINSNTVKIIPSYNGSYYALQINTYNSSDVLTDSVLNTVLEVRIYE